MTVQDLKDALSLKVLTCENGLENEVKGCYVGDLLSWVMGRAKEDCAWITVMGNINAVAVAKLADIACIILCEDSHLDEDAKNRAIENNIVILAGEDPAYEMAVQIGKALGA